MQGETELTAWQRTNITTREERGIGPISFKRLLLAGGIGAAAAMIGSRMGDFLSGFAGGGILLVVVLVLTHPRDGIPVYLYLIRTSYGLAALAALHGQSGMWAWLGSILRIDPSRGTLDADIAFHAACQDDEAGALLDEEWAHLGGFADLDDEGLSAVPSPFGAGD